MLENQTLAPTAPNGKGTVPFGIYLHIPFCVHRCSYCDFYSTTRYGLGDMEPLVARIQRETEEAAGRLRDQRVHGAPVTSVFLGGGTPSLLPLDLLERIFQTLRAEFRLDSECEITIEANPETVTPEFADGLLARTPVGRVSLGAQSFKATNLKALERLGSRESISHAVRTLRRAGVKRLSLDLIFGIPGQDRDGVLYDIASAAELAPDHVSFYNLTLKPGHPLYSGLPNDDLAADLYEAGVVRLADLGYHQYEISNFARAGEASRHNLLYWSGGDFLGLGPSASSRFFWTRRFHHRKQISDTAAYVASGPFDSLAFESTSEQQTILEAVFLELRQNIGVSLPQFHARYGYDISKAQSYDAFLKNNLIEQEGDLLRLTSRGRLLADGICRDLAPEMN